jgi:hypothetical protein
MTVHNETVARLPNRARARRLRSASRRGRPLEIALRETRLDEWDVEGLLAFSKQCLTEAARLRFDTPPARKKQLQSVFFPEGISLDGNQLEPQ